MIDGTETVSIQCPYCGEHFETSINCSIPGQDYVEDCFVCCQPIQFQVSVFSDGSIECQVSQENQSF
jgi:hypothetical protein